MKVEKWAKNGQKVQNCYPLSPGAHEVLSLYYGANGVEQRIFFTRSDCSNLSVLLRRFEIRNIVVVERVYM